MKTQFKRVFEAKAIGNKVGHKQTGLKRRVRARWFLDLIRIMLPTNHGASLSDERVVDDERVMGNERVVGDERVAES